ncbi:response regulator transcription factor [Fodinibius sediminis]|uniref:Two-component system, OmpR family, alkaline phosphatase synthesis response regulator PhoP/two-component system, OmpR family, response regulator VicR n=1 Tax=Fodinibius sediminis TaxID=1214077 RepID=A0A521DWU7_9BACT|nr:response regulator transcription factor [Fodinibius sediminis]SMO76156.1 two-component system, OmpR family, alkaline phosphatase synthesis response regulator PhoP/two-component system, OmpR family, response regulator VicR [Fodinibius sediminis]
MPADAKKIIIVEDEPSLVFTLEDTLENEGYETFIAEKGDEAVEIVKNEDLDLMILDLMLPGMSGYDVCKKVRSMNYTFPIIMLTARDQEIDKVTGLNIGADDYMTKPFGVKELLARIQARLRRSDHYAKSKPVNKLDLGDIHIDLKNARAEHPDRGQMELTTREVELIRYLAAHANEPVSRDALLENVWRYEFSTNTRTVDVHISKLRSKVERHPDDPKYLVTLHGVGYMLKMG